MEKKLKKILPNYLWFALRSFYKNIISKYFKYKTYLIEQSSIKLAPYRHKRALNKLRSKKKIKVAFFVIHESVWKYDYVYKLMEMDDRFEPIIVICPYTMYGEANMLEEMATTYYSFAGKGYNVIKTLNQETGQWLDVKKKINPDIVFFTNPHNITKKEYCITNYINILTCYVPYAFVVIHSIGMHYSQLFHKLLWKHFVETKIHENFSLEKNIIVTGYPAVDKLLDKNYIASDKWQIKNNSIKRIIWAPHHTIQGYGFPLDYSTFLDYYEFILDYTINNSKSVQVAFKPHPILKSKLYLHPDWGKEKTDKYYNTWRDLINGQLEEGEYIDLFATSDAMIMDSASFMAEYLYTSKPIMFMMRDEGIPDRFNEIGKMVFNHLYKGRNLSDVVNFFEDVVRNGHDTMKDDRIDFFKRVILPPGNNTASQNIFNELVKELC